MSPAKKKEIGGVSTKLHPSAGAHHPPGNTYTPRHHLLGMIVAVLKLQLLNLNARHLLALKQQSSYFGKLSLGHRARGLKSRAQISI